MIKIKNTFVLILLIVNICHAQNDIFDIKNEKDFIITDNPKHFIGDGFLEYMAMEGQYDVMQGEKDLKYSFGFSWQTLSRPMISSKKIVEIDGGTKKKMIIYTNSLGATVPFYYFKNLKFKEGTYEMYELYEFYTRNKYKVKGNEIDVSERTKNILFKNIKVNNKYIDLRFKDIEFTVIDFK